MTTAHRLRRKENSDLGGSENRGWILMLVGWHTNDSATVVVEIVIIWDHKYSIHSHSRIPESQGSASRPDQFTLVIISIECRVGVTVGLAPETERKIPAISRYWTLIPQLVTCRMCWQASRLSPFVVQQASSPKTLGDYRWSWCWGRTTTAIHSLLYRVCMGLIWDKI